MVEQKIFGLPVVVMPIDYRSLLQRYIDYVRMCEGTSFLDHCEQRSTAGVPFTDEEWGELLKLAGEVD